MLLGKTLTIHCKNRNWSLARLAREAGVPKATLHGWTVGRRVLDITQLKKVAATLEISLHELVFGVPDPHQPALRISDLEELFSGDIRVSIQRIVRNGTTPNPSERSDK